MVQPYLEPMIRGKSAIVSCWDLFQVCLQRLLFQVLYQALHALRKSAHPALQQSETSDALCGCAQPGCCDALRRKSEAFCIKLLMHAHL